MEKENIKIRNRTTMAITACFGGFFGVHNFLLLNDVSGCIKIYLTLIAIVAPGHIGLGIAIVDFAWILFDLGQICFVSSLPEIRFEGSRKKAAAFVTAFLTVASLSAFFILSTNS
jgi:hypothetical protein